MLLSISLILLVGMSVGWICKKMKLPSLLGMLVTGMVLGPYMLNLLDDSILGISAELRKIALIIILTRAGLGLDLSGLKKIGRPAVLMCFVPASLGKIMLLSISLILLVGMSVGWICQKMKLPSLLGMLVTGMVLGPYMLNLLDNSILGISPELRKIALIIILTRAGLGLDLSGLKKIGRPAVLMCFVPASLELLGILLIAPKLLGISMLEAAILGAVLAAVSPAVVVPRMVKLMEEGYGVREGIPQLILAGASVDEVYVIV